MSLLVVDNSLFVHAFIDARDNRLLLQRLSGPRKVHAPGLVDFEFMHVMKCLVQGRKISEQRALAAIADFGDLPINRHSGVDLRDRMWSLRHNFSAYDASYIALAEQLDCPLLTCDKKMLGAHNADVQVIPT